MIGNVLDEGQIVRDEEVGELKFLSQIKQKIADLGMDGNVQR